MRDRIRARATRPTSNINPRTVETRGACAPGLYASHEIRHETGRTRHKGQGCVRPCPACWPGPIGCNSRGACVPAVLSDLSSLIRYRSYLFVSKCL